MYMHTCIDMGRSDTIKPIYTVLCCLVGSVGFYIVVCISLAVVCIPSLPLLFVRSFLPSFSFVSFSHFMVVGLFVHIVRG